MSDKETIPESLRIALENIFQFVEEVTGQRPSADELARALRRYFVLNEIKEHLLLEWASEDEPK